MATLQELENAIREADKKGASKAEMQKLASFYDSEKKRLATATKTDEPGFVQSVVQGFAGLPKKIGASGAAIVSGVTAGAGKAGETLGIPGAKNLKENSLANIDTLMKEGADLGYFGKAKPFGASAISEYKSGKESATGAIVRSGLDIGGGMLEAASYMIAPMIPKGGGFWKALATGVFEGAKQGLTFGVGKGAQGMGEGKTAGEAATTAATETITAMGTFGLLRGGGQFIKSWGAKALQTPAFKAAQQQIVDFADKTFTSFYDAFDNNVIDLSNKTIYRTYNALKNEYNQLFKKTSDSAIDALAPGVDNEDYVIGEFRKKVGQAIGSKFGLKKELYDEISSNPEVINRFDLTLNKLKVLEKADKNNMALYSALRQEIGFRNFTTTSIGDKPKEVTLGRLLDIIQKITDDANSLPSGEARNNLLSITHSLYEDANSFLKVKNPELQMKWTEARQAFTKAQEMANSSVVNTFKDLGYIDNSIEKIVSGKATGPEMELISNAMKESPEAMRDVILSSVLRTAKSMKDPNDASKFIQDFLTNWGDTFMQPGQVKALDDLSQFMGGNFNDFITEQRKALGLDPAQFVSDAGELAKNKVQMDIMSFVKDGNVDELSSYVSNIKPKDMLKVLDSVDDKTRKVIGATKLKEVFDTNKPLLSINTDGTINMDEFAKGVQKSVEDLNKFGGASKEEITEKLFGKELKTKLAELNKVISDVDDLSKVEEGSLKSILMALLGVVQTTSGNPIGGILNINKGVTSFKLPKNAIEWVETYLKGQSNATMRFGDLIQLMTKPVGKGVLQVEDTVVDKLQE